MPCRAYVAPCRRPCRATAEKTTTMHGSHNKVQDTRPGSKPTTLNSKLNVCSTRTRACLQPRQRSSTLARRTSSCSKSGAVSTQRQVCNSQRGCPHLQTHCRTYARQRSTPSSTSAALPSKLDFNQANEAPRLQHASQPNSKSATGTLDVHICKLTAEG